LIVCSASAADELVASRRYRRFRLADRDRKRFAERASLVESAPLDCIPPGAPSADGIVPA
jgi:hypothetical protein